MFSGCGSPAGFTKTTPRKRKCQLAGENRVYDIRVVNGGLFFFGAYF
jgi:hypothetical protein